LKEALRRLGAAPSMLSGSGAALFGLFPSRTASERAGLAFRKENVVPVSLLSCARYRALWRRALRAHSLGSVWPPQSRYAR
jgi:4-diphosphocytidyl-2C-methyl-D-erythritol kinase